LISFRLRAPFWERTFSTCISLICSWKWKFTYCVSLTLIF
jgi:hypothetical protein